MGRPRLVDYDEVRLLWATGMWTRKELAAKFGVSLAPIDRAIHPEYAERQDARQRDYMTPCSSCGTPVHGKYVEGRLCRSCYAKTRTTTVRETTLQCLSCRRWDFDEGFPRNRVETARRGRHTICRQCQAAMRQKSRQARAVPCANCGEPRTHPLDTGSLARGLRDTGLCYACYQQQRKQLRGGKPGTSLTCPPGES